MQQMTPSELWGPDGPQHNMYSTLGRQQENVGLRVCVQLCTLNLLHGGHVMIL